MSYNVYSIASIEKIKQKPLECNMSININNSKESFIFFIVSNNEEEQIFATYSGKTRLLEKDKYTPFTDTIYLSRNDTQILLAVVQ